MKLQLLAGGALVALLSACASDPVYYGDSYYPYTYYSPSGYYYGDRYSYNRYPTYYDDRVTSIEVLNGTPVGGIVVGAPIEQHPRATGNLYRVIVRNANGTYETYVMESLGTLRVGDKVRVSNGTIYPIG